jgi:hypothetical protein
VVRAEVVAPAAAKSAIIDLNITLEQAFQYYLSCGVLVPEHQRATPELLHREVTKRLSGAFGPAAALGKPGDNSTWERSRSEVNPADGSSLDPEAPK